MALDLPYNEKEFNVIRKAVKTYRLYIKNIKKQEDFLKNMKFHFGDYIIRKDTKHMERVFGCGEGSIGKIVGYDHEYKWYRVYYNDKNPYIGVREEDIENYTGEIPEYLEKYDPYDIDSIYVKLK